MDGGNGTALRRADRLYARLLWLLPGGFRREYGPAMRQTFADLCTARVDARGRGLTPVLAHGLADLAGGAAAEWAATLFARDRWHRTAAAGLCALAGLLVLYGQVRYPANLLRIDHLIDYPLLLVVLAALAGTFARSATVSARAVGWAVATLPGCLAAARLPLAGFGYVAVLILVAAIAEARHARHRYAGIRAGLTGGALAGVTVLTVNVATGILDMPRLLRNATYHAGYLRSGQPDPAAYIIGARTCGAALLLLACVAAGALLGLTATAAAAAARRGRPFPLGL